MCDLWGRGENLWKLCRLYLFFLNKIEAAGYDSPYPVLVYAQERGLLLMG